MKEERKGVAGTEAFESPVQSSDNATARRSLQKDSCLAASLAEAYTHERRSEGRTLPISSLRMLERNTLQMRKQVACVFQRGIQIGWLPRKQKGQPHARTRRPSNAAEKAGEGERPPTRLHAPRHQKQERKKKSTAGKAPRCNPGLTRRNRGEDETRMGGRQMHDPLRIPQSTRLIAVRHREMGERHESSSFIEPVLRLPSSSSSSSSCSTLLRLDALALKSQRSRKARKSCKASHSDRN